MAGTQGFTNVIEDEIINYFLRNVAHVISSPTTVYVALCKSSPGETATDLSGGVEHENDGNGYSRKAVTFSDPTGDGLTSNTGAIVWTATANWTSTVTDFAIMDSGTWNAGNCFFYGALSSSATLTTDDTLTIGIGGLDITLD